MHDGLAYGARLLLGPQDRRACRCDLLPPAREALALDYINADDSGTFCATAEEAFLAEGFMTAQHFTGSDAIHTCTKTLMSIQLSMLRC